jgi:hypothetical protein
MMICLLFLLGCDPGIAIRQAPPPHKGINGRYGEKLNVQVSPYRTLAYSSIYAARINLTNRSEVELTIDRIELITRQGVYRKNDRTSHGLPSVLKPNATADVGAWFELKAPLHDTFKTPAQLKIYYHAGTNGKEQIVGTKLISR